MNKIKIISAVLVLLATVSIYGGPFGIEMGMKISDIDKNAKSDDGIIYSKVSVPKPHKAFSHYTVYTCPSSSGIFMVRAFTGNLKSNVFGEQIKSEFNSLEEKLKKVYGKNKRLDFLREGSLWTERQDWMMSLKKGDRTLASFWAKQHQSSLPDNIEGVMLRAYGVSSNSGFIQLEYQFMNTEKCINEINSKEDDAL